MLPLTCARWRGEARSSGLCSGVYWGSSWPCRHHHQWAVPPADLPWATWPHGPARWCHAALPKMTRPPAPSGCQWPRKWRRPHRGREGSGLTRRKGLTLTMKNTPASFCRLSLPSQGTCPEACVTPAGGRGTSQEPVPAGLPLTSTGSGAAAPSSIHR